MVAVEGYLGIRIERDELHRKIGEGIPKGALMLIEGEDGGGKSVVSQRLLYGFLNNDCAVTYVSAELATKDFLLQMNSLGYSVVDYILNKKLLFIPMFPRLGSSKVRKDLLECMIGAEELFKNDVTIIDSLNTSVMGRFTKEDVFRLISFFKRVIGMEKTVIVTANPGIIDEDMLNLLISVSDIHFKIEVRRVGLDINRAILVKRFRGSLTLSEDTVGFKVEPKKGFAIDITTVI